MREYGSDASVELRKLPQLDRLASSIGTAVPHALKVQVLRQLLDETRVSVLAGAKAPTLEELAEEATGRCSPSRVGVITRVINATGVILHTNLGRAPLSVAAADAAHRAALGYTDLEYDLSFGARGSRYTKVSELLRVLTGAEDAIVVNNNAAALMLSIKALGEGGSVIVSRGEMIEIGGGFRLPEIIASAGAELVEVGTTNKTRLSDYSETLSGNAAVILKVHPSNYSVVGFASSVDPKDLAELAASRGVAFINDVGSGLIRRNISGVDAPWLAHEPTVVDSVSEGADIVTFSGDKLLGGPQAGLLVGKREAIARIRALPLLRTARADKMTLAALGATLMTYLEGDEAELPIWRMAALDADTLRARCLRLIADMGEVSSKVKLAETWSTSGGGSAPDTRIPTVAVEVRSTSLSADQIAKALRTNEPAIISRIEGGSVIIDLRCVDYPDDVVVAKALREL